SRQVARHHADRRRSPAYRPLNGSPAAAPAAPAAAARRAAAAAARTGSGRRGSDRGRQRGAERRAEARRAQAVERVAAEPGRMIAGAVAVLRGGAQDVGELLRPFVLDTERNSVRQQALVQLRGLRRRRLRELGAFGGCEIHLKPSIWSITLRPAR